MIATLPYINDTSAPITEGKMVQGIELPTGGTIPASGRISGMHIFAPLSATGAPLTGPAT